MLEQNQLFVVSVFLRIIQVIVTMVITSRREDGWAVNMDSWGISESDSGFLCEAGSPRTDAELTQEEEQAFLPVLPGCGQSDRQGWKRQAAHVTLKFTHGGRFYTGRLLSLWH